MKPLIPLGMLSGTVDRVPSETPSGTVDRGCIPIRALLGALGTSDQVLPLSSERNRVSPSSTVASAGEAPAPGRSKFTQTGFESRRLLTLAQQEALPLHIWLPECALRSRICHGGDSHSRAQMGKCFQVRGNRPCALPLRKVKRE